ncbi:helix-turn-helix domain-containing protein [Rosistilla oblonga]|uniref:helix-turn-helix domain-containing protein n=1 Tax=Rosistilla oblonga TaxID=2527990 RepID=UPI003A96B94A
MIEQHYTPQRTAELLDTDDEQVLAWIHAGDLPASNVAKSSAGKRPRWRISESDLGKFLLSRRHPASQPKPAAKVARRPQPKQYV